MQTAIKYMKSNYISISQAMIVAALAAGALTAQADWIIVGPADVTVTPGESGTSTYRFTTPTAPPATGIVVSQTDNYQAEGSGINQAINASAPITNYQPATSPVGNTLDAGTTDEITVDWTISSNPAYIGHEYSANYGIDTDAYGSASAAQNFIIETTPAPEPSQIAGLGVLLGCGGAVFGIRRCLGKKATAA
jgi:hypothetical protein